MKLIILAITLAVSTALPSQLGGSSSHDHDFHHEESHEDNFQSTDYVKIVRDERQGPLEDGSYSFDFETEDGIVRSGSGTPLNIEGNPIGQQGSVSFTFPDGENFDLRFVADEGGFQPESKWIPVAPEFPHPIPDFVQEQIERAALEDAAVAAQSPNVDEGQFPFQETHVVA